MRELKDVPGLSLETAIGFNKRDPQRGAGGQLRVAQPPEYLDQFLSVARQYACATEDDSWGELEKLLAIVFRNHERMTRTIDFFSKATGLDYEELEQFGEEEWRMKDESRRRIDGFIKALEKYTKS